MKKFLIFFFIVFLGKIGVVGATGESAHGESQFWPFIFSVINFLLFLIVLYIFAFPRVKKFFFDRSQNILQALKEAEEAKILAEKKFKEYEEKLLSLEKEIEEMRRGVEQEAKLEKEKIISGAKKEAEIIKWQAKIIAEQEVKKAKNELRREVINLALNIAEKIIREKITEQDHNRLIQDYITQITQQIRYVK